LDHFVVELRLLPTRAGDRNWVVVVVDRSGKEEEEEEEEEECM
jgi:hypothetical protein